MRGQLVGTLFADEEVVTQNLRDLGLRLAFTQVRYGRLFLASSCNKASSTPICMSSSGN